MKTLALTLLATVVFAQAPKSLPPPGVAIPAAVRATLEAKLKELNQNLEPIAKHPLLPDVLIFRDAVHTALTYNEFFKEDEGLKAVKLLEEGLLRARQLASGQSPWTTASGLIVRGYISKIDGSVQPYGLVIPAGWQASGAAPWRLDTWLAGRSDVRSEVNFLTERMTRPGEFAPPDAIVLHPYGRYCNATKFAGEVDVLEAQASVKSRYRIDEDRAFIRGFSMGGASSWHIGAHFADRWAGVAPGAGFAETREYQGLEKKGDVRPWYEQKLWRWYDATEYAANFYNTPLIAYSGEIDKQIQAAQIMQRYLAQEGMALAHVIGPNTEHKYHPDSKPILESRLAAIAKTGRDTYPRTLRFTTYTLRYNRMRWITVDALNQHWERARVNAEITAAGEIQIQTQNVAGLTIHFGSGGWQQPLDRKVSVRIDGQPAGQLQPLSDQSLQGSFSKTPTGWQSASPNESLRKRHGLQGPIDDAFLSSFVMVLPSGKPQSEATGKWVEAESSRAIRNWRSLFRGAARVKKDSEITDADIAASNLILWGDPASNAVLARIAAKLPLEWNSSKLSIGKNSCDAQGCMPVMVYPNPLNPKRYIVLNSGPTFREDSNGTNSLQTPRLPDFALIDLSEAPGPVRPGKVVAADFFNESWQVPNATRP
ncbi:prolyl oligopeptidase family serine peptidase [Bryobacter aggregatus]|uniref:prolyl oligopeptidase family serine peptidase n=1 Tax=Bryobacter aggregatus TaxID=360054 RepID=UPI0004E11AEC|nr:prolyl oligopeptidase family serine peptidase [Bryobacter aggregatus]